MLSIIGRHSNKLRLSVTTDSLCFFSRLLPKSSYSFNHILWYFVPYTFHHCTSTYSTFHYDSQHSLLFHFLHTTLSKHHHIHSFPSYSTISIILYHISHFPSKSNIFLPLSIYIHTSFIPHIHLYHH